MPNNPWDVPVQPPKAPSYIPRVNQPQAGRDPFVKVHTAPVPASLATNRPASDTGGPIVEGNAIVQGTSEITGSTIVTGTAVVLSGVYSSGTLDSGVYGSS